MEGGNQVAGEAICCDDSGCTRHIRDGAAWGVGSTSLSHEHCTTDSTGVIVENQTPPSHSFHQALALCRSVGLRLPKTQAEVDSTCGTGCHFNFVLVWMDSECDENTNIGHRQDGYRGCQDHSRNGNACENWISARNNWARIENGESTRFPNKGLGDYNFCRNPDHEPEGIWCWTASAWEYCNPLPLVQVLTPAPRPTAVVMGLGFPDPHHFP